MPIALQLFFSIGAANGGMCNLLASPPTRRLVVPPDQDQSCYPSAEPKTWAGTFWSLALAFRVFRRRCADGQHSRLESADYSPIRFCSFASEIFSKD
jgi:hypothetical protein